MQQIAEAGQLFAQTIGGIVAVVEVDFYFAAALAHEVAEGVEAGGVVLLFGVEEGVTRHAAIRIAEGLGHGGIRSRPARDMCARGRVINTVAVGFIMITQCDNQVARAARVTRSSPQRRQIAG